MLNLEDDLTLDVLLRDVSRDFDVSDVVVRRSGKPGRRKHRSYINRRRAGNDGSIAPLIRERTHFERRLTQACIVAFGIVVLWISITSPSIEHLFDANTAVVAEETVAPPDAMADGQMLNIIDKGNGRLYISRLFQDTANEQALGTNVAVDEAPLTAAIPLLPVGSMLRVTNPASGVSVVVKVAQSNDAEREILLSPGAVSSLGLQGTAIVFVEVLSVPPTLDLAP
jgi:hypothetical protein